MCPLPCSPVPHSPPMQPARYLPFSTCVFLWECFLISRIWSSEDEGKPEWQGIKESTPHTHIPATCNPWVMGFGGYIPHLLCSSDKITLTCMFYTIPKVPQPDCATTVHSGNWFHNHPLSVSFSSVSHFPYSCFCDCSSSKLLALKSLSWGLLLGEPNQDRYIAQIISVNLYHFSKGNVTIPILQMKKQGFREVN